MCCDEDAPEVSLSFAAFVGLLPRPPFEPCQSELEFLTQTEYDKTFAVVWKQYFRTVRFYIARIIGDWEVESRGIAASTDAPLLTISIDISSNPSYKQICTSQS